MSALPKTAMHLSRPTERNRGRPQTPERKAVQAVLESATTASPLTIAQIAGRAGVAIEKASQHVANICHRGMAHRCKGGRGGGSYAWGAAASGVPAARYTPPAGHYDGAELRPIATRPGAMRAYSLPSLHNGESVDRVRPISMGAAPEGRRR